MFETEEELSDRTISETTEEIRHFRFRVPHPGIPIAPEIPVAHLAYRERLAVPDEVVDLMSEAEDKEKAPEDDDDDDDDIAHDPEIRAMWERGEHTCEMFDAPCAVCLKDNEEEYDGEVRVMTEEEVQNDPALTAQPCS